MKRFALAAVLAAVFGSQADAQIVYSSYAVPAYSSPSIYGGRGYYSRGYNNYYTPSYSTYGSGFASPVVPLSPVGPVLPVNPTFAPAAGYYAAPTYVTPTYVTPTYVSPRVGGYRGRSVYRW